MRGLSLGVVVLQLWGCTGLVSSLESDGGELQGPTDGGGAGGGSGGGGQGGGGGAGGGSGGGGGSYDAGQVGPGGDAGSADVLFEVNAAADVRAISPLIYGVNGSSSVAPLGSTLLRVGGNRWTAYNWENNASNAGSDYLYQNDGYLSSSNSPGEALNTRIAGATSAGAAVLLTLPIVDHVAADKNGGGDVRNTANHLDTRFRKNKAVKGAPLSTTPDATDDSVYQDEFVNWLKTTHGTTRVLFSLDNEPDLWSDTHPEVHPGQVGYDELCTRSVTFAKMVKSVWPSAEVTGFVSYGWNGYTTLQNAPDAAGKGEFIDYFLDRMKAAEASEGKRLVDYLDVHWYPEAKGGGTRITGTDSSAAVVAARVQAPRSLWDSSYTETSWVANSVGGPIRLLPRLAAKVAARYPGTKLAVTEWNYGGGDHVSGALATADVLGIFGRDGVGLANFWGLNSDESYAHGAFKAFRNYDGAGAKFGDTSVRATSNNVPLATVYASSDAANPARLVIVAINKDTQARVAGISIAHGTSFARLRVFTITSSGPSPTAGAPVPAVGPNAFRYTMPALSVSVLEAQP